ncbi:MAG: molybdate ABC transporter substrate-binding protein [Chloroflexi bacterium]|nr:MAG: molybdate ABC transporter substrate-binding protein [Chloroflexota bacterium]
MARHAHTTALTRRFVVLAVALAALAAMACGGDTAAPATPSATTSAGSSAPVATAPPVTGEIIVSAASSLTEAFTDTAKAFEVKYAGTKVTLNFASSAALATQVNEGSPADVFASADRAQMDAVKTERKSAAGAVFALNRLLIAKPKGSTAVATYADLAKPNLKVILAADGVPVGSYAIQSLAAAEKSVAFGAGFQAKVMANVKSREANVRAVLTKVQLGEADAAIIYSTDIATAPEVEPVAIPNAYNVTAEYFIAPLTGGKNANTAAAFVAFVRGAEGQAFLTKRGFTIPPR